MIHARIASQWLTTLHHRFGSNPNRSVGLIVPTRSREVSAVALWILKELLVLKARERGSSHAEIRTTPNRDDHSNISSVDGRTQRVNNGEPQHSIACIAGKRVGCRRIHVPRRCNFASGPLPSLGPRDRQLNVRRLAKIDNDVPARVGGITRRHNGVRIGIVRDSHSTPMILRTDKLETVDNGTSPKLKRQRGKSERRQTTHGTPASKDYIVQIRRDWNAGKMMVRCLRSGPVDKTHKPWASDDIGESHIILPLNANHARIHSELILRVERHLVGEVGTLRHRERSE